MIIKTYKYKLKIKKSQVEKFNNFLGVTRLVYNLAKTRREYYYKSTSKNLSAYDLQKEIVQLKKEFDWMKALPKDTLNAPIFRLEKSLKSFFKGHAKYPKWAKKKFWNSLEFIQTNANTVKPTLRIENGKIKLHKGIYLRYFNSRDLPEDAKIFKITIKKEIDGWYACISFRTNSHKIIPINNNQVVGVDWGVSRFITLSNGEYHDNLRWFQQIKLKLEKEQKKLKYKQKGSNNEKKQYIKIAKIYRSLQRKRLDWQQKITTDLVKNYSGFVLEDLNIENMTRRPKPKLAKDGKTYFFNKAKAKAGLNREILSTAARQFADILKYKSEWNNRYFNRVNPSYTSQECSNCHYIDKNNRKTQSEFICIECGLILNADENAAINILGRDHYLSQD